MITFAYLNNYQLTSKKRHKIMKSTSVILLMFLLSFISSCGEPAEITAQKNDINSKLNALAIDSRNIDKSDKNKLNDLIDRYKSVKEDVIKYTEFCKSQGHEKNNDETISDIDANIAKLQGLGGTVSDNSQKNSTEIQYPEAQRAFQDNYDATVKQLIDQEKAAEGNSVLFKEADDKVEAYNALKHHADNWIAKIVSVTKSVQQAGMAGGEENYYVTCDGYKTSYFFTLPELKFSEDEIKKLTPGTWIRFSGDKDKDGWNNVTYSIINP